MLYFISFSAVSLISTEETKEIKEAFESIFQQKSSINMLFRYRPHLRADIINMALENYMKNAREEFMDDSGWTYSISGIIEKDYKEGLCSYLKPVFKMNFNRYISKQFFDFSVSTPELDSAGFGSSIDRGNCTPLIFAVALNRYDIVKEMVEADLNPKLQLDMPYRIARHISARGIAKKISDQEKRRAMLKLLIVDQTRHDTSLTKSFLKDELTITVKEAVIANDAYMVESALLLGNFGDKTDIHVIRWAMKNENLMILEMLVVEEYAIPDIEDRPYITKKNKDRVNSILNQIKVEERLIQDRYSF